MKLTIFKLIIHLLKLPFWILIMALKGADLNTIYLTVGSSFLRLGAHIQVGQPWVVPQPLGRPSKKLWVKNIYFNFASNKVTATYSPKPIKGKSERFKKK